MNFDRLKEIARKSMLKNISHAERETGFIHDHGARVAKGVIQLRKLITPDNTHDNLLTCAGMFHDVGKGIGEHGATGAALVRFLLSGELDADELNEVARLVRLHNKRGSAESDIWAKLLQDADVLDHYGSVQLWLNFFYYARHGGRFMDSVEFYDTEFQKEYEQARSILNFEASRSIFDEKYEFVLSVVNRMRVEGAGEYIGV